jgi:protocatechuate 3,4-dioxygenase beta subunit
MDPKLTRRGALAVSLGSLLAACGGDDETAEVTTTEGATTTVEPKTGTSTTDEFAGAGSCTLTPEQTEGPYYFDTDAIRSDIREDREGALLRLALRVRDAETCEPIENAVVDIWHCDAGGVYSGFEAGEGERFLRGAQATNEEGVARFRTVYPGWYQGRTVHIHVKVHLDNSTVLTSQLYFDDSVSDRVFASAPYTDAGERDQRNDSDGIFDEQLVMKVSRSGEGWSGAFSFDVNRA